MHLRLVSLRLQHLDAQSPSLQPLVQVSASAETSNKNDVLCGKVEQISSRKQISKLGRLMAYLWELTLLVKDGMDLAKNQCLDLP